VLLLRVERHNVEFAFISTSAPSANENIPAYKITVVLIPFCDQLLQKISPNSYNSDETFADIKYRQRPPAS
jgi:TRAP-type uncharacterized transport system substrate-binding protein